MVMGLRLSLPVRLSLWSRCRQWMARRLEQEEAKIPCLADLLAEAGLPVLDCQVVKKYQ